MGTPLWAGAGGATALFSPAGSAVPLRAAAAWASEARSADAARAASGSGAERMAAISGRGAGGGAQMPPVSLARTALVIQARSSTRRSSASATRSSDWL
ncbi:hypothetical protein ACVWXU_006992 [Streptomyces sp. TE33382]